MAITVSIHNNRLPSSILQGHSHIEGGRTYEMQVSGEVTQVWGRWHRSGGGTGRQGKSKQVERCPFPSLLICTVGWTQKKSMYVQCQEDREEGVKRKIFDLPTNQTCLCSLSVDVHAIFVLIYFFRADLGPIYILFSGQSGEGTWDKLLFFLRRKFQQQSLAVSPFKANSLPPRKPSA